jgi:hypothetical protein
MGPKITMRENPIPDSYWVLPDQFLAGGYPGLRNDEALTRMRLIALLNSGFNTFLDLTNESERPPYFAMLVDEASHVGSDVRHQRFSFPDYDVPSNAKMVITLDAIDSALADDFKVYLHCVGGIGRTGTTVGCYLVRHGMKPMDALLHLRRLYRSSAQSLLAPVSPESDAQVNFILNWKEHGLA